VVKSLKVPPAMCTKSAEKSSLVSSLLLFLEKWKLKINTKQTKKRRSSKTKTAQLRKELKTDLKISIKRRQINLLNGGSPLSASQLILFASIKKRPSSIVTSPSKKNPLIVVS